MDLAKAPTETRNPDSANLDQMSSLEIVELMNREDHKVLAAVSAAAPVVAAVVDAIATAFQGEGRLFYVGAGTSGRLGVLDASECPPTFSTPAHLVQGIIAGGMKAFERAVEEAEDQPRAGARELEERGLAAADVVVGISASGRTPFVLGALEKANQVGATTAGIFCNPGAPLGEVAQHAILLPVGPEILTGSTRLKAGTATKLVLNQLTTAAMVRSGRSFGNLMVDLSPACEKLRDRTVRILAQALELDTERASKLLEKAGGELRVAMVMGRGAASPEAARNLLAECGDDLKRAMQKAAS